MQENAKPPREALDAAALQIRGMPVKMATAKK